MPSVQKVFAGSNFDIIRCEQSWGFQGLGQEAMIEKVLRKPCRGEKEFWEEINVTNILQTKTEAEFEQRWIEEQNVDATFPAHCSAVQRLDVACVEGFLNWQ